MAYAGGSDDIERIDASDAIALGQVTNVEQLLIWTRVVARILHAANNISDPLDVMVAEETQNVSQGV